MKFHEYTTIEQRAKYDPAVRAALVNSVQLARDNGGAQWKPRTTAEAACYGFLMTSERERTWVAARRPYYSIYPVIAESLLKIDLEKTKGSSIALPVDALLVRFPIGREAVVGGLAIKCFLAIQSVDGSGRWLVIIANTAPLAGLAVPNNRVAILRMSEETVESSIEEYFARSDGLNSEVNPLRACMRLMCTLCLLGDNSEIIKPDVLDNDRRAYEETSDPKYVDKAHRRGKIGWTIGADIEVSAHFRRPHFGLRWTGPGGTIPRIVPIKGTMVHKDKLMAVPQGYLDDQPRPET
jgi:hypothetical protein